MDTNHEEDDVIFNNLCSANGIEPTSLTNEGFKFEKLEIFFSGFPRIVKMFSFPSLSQLIIINQPITIIENLEMCTNLVSLWICECSITDIEGLSLCNQIKNLYLYGNKIRKIKNLYSLKSLEVIWLNNNKIELIEGLDELILLRELNVAGNEIKYIGNSLINNTSIIKLDISGNQLEYVDDLLNLRGLPKLKYLSINGPDYVPNPVFHHINYFIFFIYHFPNLKRLDTFDITSNYLKELVLNTINKKKLFYFMKLESVDRDMSFIKLQLKINYDKLCEYQKTRLQNLSKLSMLMNLNFQYSKTKPTDVFSLPSPRKDMYNSHEIKEINDRIESVEKFIKSYQTEIKFYLKKIEIYKSEIKSLFQLEFSSCGNFRFELSSDKIWVNLCNELISSRFCNSEFGFDDFLQIKTHRVIKIKNFQIESNYVKLIQKLYENVERNEKFGIDDCKIQDYLFLFIDENGNKCPLSILDTLYSSSDSGVIKLTNSLYNGDLIKMKGSSNNNVYYGRVILVKSFVGLSKSNPVLNSEFENFLTTNSLFETYKIATTKREHQNICSCSKYKYDWYFKTNKLLVPEYIVDYEYVLRESERSKFYYIYHGIQKDFMSEIPSIDELDRDFDNIKKKLNFDEIKNNCLTSIFRTLECSLENITILNLTNSYLQNVSELSLLINLKELFMPFNNLLSLKDIGNRKLKILDVSFNQIQTLFEMHELPKLMSLNIQNNFLVKTKEEISTLHRCVPNLIKLNVKYNLFQKPKSVRLRIISGLKYLKMFNDEDIEDCEIKLANDLASKWRILDIQIMNYGRTDTLNPRTLLLDNMANILMICSDNSISNQIKEHSEFMRITSLCLDNQYITKISNIERLVNLKYVSLSNNLISKIECLDNCSHLEELILDNNTITDIENLSKMKKLKRISLNENYVTSISYLRNLTNLQVLSIHTNKLSSFSGIEDCNCLTELYAANNCVCESTEIFILKNLTNLVILDLHNNPVVHTIKNYRLNMIYNLKHLKGLDGICVENYEIYHSKDVLGGRLNLEFIRERFGNENYNALTELDVPNCCLKSVDLTPVEKLQNLRSINLENNNLTSFSGLIAMSNLKVLCLNSNSIESIISRSNKTLVQPIPKTDNNHKVNLRSLEVLHLGYNNIKSIIQLGLNDIPSLRALFLQGNDISTIDGLGSLINLTELVLDQNRIKYISDNSFNNNIYLQEIHLDDNRIKSLTSIYHLKYLKRLYLVNNKITDLHDLDLFYSFESLVDISLFGNPISRRHQHRPYLIHMIPTLLMIDGIEITEDERYKVESNIDENADNNVLPGIVNQSKNQNSKPNSNFYNLNDFSKIDYLRSDTNYKKRSNAANYYNFNNKTNSIQLVANSKTIYFYDPISQLESIPRLNLNKRK